MDGMFQYQTHSINLFPKDEGYLFVKRQNDKLILVNDSYGFAYNTQELKPKISAIGKSFDIKDFENNIVSYTNLPVLSFNTYSQIKEINNQLLTPCNILKTPNIESEITFYYGKTTYNTTDGELQFEIMVEANTIGVEFADATLYLEYTEAFGEYAVNNNNVDIEKGDLINSSNYKIAKSDKSKNVIAIEVSSSSKEGATLLNNDPISILKGTIQINDNSLKKLISFQNVDLTGKVKYWCNNQKEPYEKVNLRIPVKPIETEPKNPVGITYTFENAVYNSVYNYFDVEVWASATAPSNFSDANIFIDYNSTEVSSVSFYRLDLIQDVNTYDLITEDVVSNPMEFYIWGPLDANGTQIQNLQILDSSPRALFKLRFQLTGCEEELNLSFNPMTPTSPGNHLYFDSYNDMWEPYTPVTANDIESGPNCNDCQEPEIISFSPTTIVAGNDEILTITGNNFGTFDSNSSKVWFKNGDDGGNTYIYGTTQVDAMSNGIVQWTDTEIKIKVPSSDALNGVNKPAASGMFKVQNACGEVISDDELEISYALMNRRAGSVAKKIGLRQLDNDGVCFQLSSQVPFWIRTEFENAIDAWCAKTGINFYISNTYYSGTSQIADGISSITVEIVSTTGGVAAVLFDNNLVPNCQSGNGYTMNEIDIKIDPSYGNISGSSVSVADKIKMQNFLRHELGHAQMLNHSITLGASASNSIMYYSLTGFSSIKSIETNDALGANQVFSNSATILNGSTCGTPIGNTGACGSTCSVSNDVSMLTKTTEIKIYPNPANEYIFIDSDITIKKDSKINIYNLTGEEVYNYLVSEGTTELTLNIDLPTGLYLIQYQNGEEQFTTKITVQ